VPNALPPRILWTEDTVLSLSAADQALGRLAGVGQSLANPHLLIQPFLRREAVLSSRIEGTVAELTDLFLFEANESAEQNAPDVHEVHNYVTALEDALKQLRHYPLTLNKIRNIHKTLMRGVRGQEKTPGEFRRRQNWIGRGDCPIERATYVPPPPETLMSCLDAFEKYLHAPTRLPHLVRLAMIHYQFEAIHPFNDGNGRIGRLLITLLLCLEQTLPQPLLYLSAYFEEHQQAYYDHLLNVSRDGRWTEWIIFFLEGVREQAEDAIVRSNKLLALRDEFRKVVQRLGAPSRMLELVDHLFEAPVISVADVHRLLPVNPRTALGYVNKLVELNILKEITGRRRDRLFAAEKIIRAVDKR
jgi:Fic family protein